MINFPSNPVDGQQYTNDGRSWQYSTATTAWDLIPVSTSDANSAAAAALSAAASAAAAAGTIVSTAYNPPSLTNGAAVTTTIAVAGAVLGDFAQASFDKDLQGIQLSAWVSAAGVVSIRFQNNTGGTLDLASGTLRARRLHF